MSKKKDDVQESTTQALEQNSDADMENATQEQETAQDSEPENEKPEPQTAPKKPERKKQYKILIHSQEGIPGGNKAVPVTLNGKTWNIPRNVENWVPYGVMKILERAIQTKYEPKWEGNQMKLIPRRVKRIACSVLDSKQP